VPNAIPAVTKCAEYNAPVSCQNLWLSLKYSQMS